MVLVRKMALSTQICQALYEISYVHYCAAWLSTSKSHNRHSYMKRLNIVFSNVLYICLSMYELMS
jgi:hypothetical protein